MSTRRFEVAGFVIAAPGVNYAARLAVSIAGPDILKQYRLSEVQLGFVFSAFRAAYALAMTPAGWLADRLGPRHVLGVAGLASALATAATGAAGLLSAAAALPALWIARLLFGLFSAPVFPSCGRIAAHWFAPSKQALIQGLILGGSAVGASGGPVVCNALVARFGWRGSFYAVAAALAAFFAAWLARVGEDPSQQRSGPSGGAVAKPALRRVLGNRVIVLLILSYACLGYIYEVFDSWIYYYFREVRRFGADPSAWFTSLAQATVLLSSPLGGWASDYAAARSPRGRAGVAVTVLASSALLFFAGTRSAEMATTVGLFAAAFGLASAAEGGYWATAIQSCRDSAASAYAVVNTGGNLGGLLAPVLLPALAGRFGWSGGLMSACVAAAGAALGWLLLPRLAANH